VNDHALFTIGELARRTGLPVRTIRFWSDSDVVVPVGRSAGGYRLYDTTALAKLELVRTLRELGLDLSTVRRVLRGQDSVPDVALAHVRALDAEIRTLRLRRAVLWSVAHRSGTTEELRTVHELTRLSVAERQRIIDDFVEEAFAGIDLDTPGRKLAEGMRQMPAELPAEPTPEQVDAWVELAELVRDQDFRRRVREMVLAGDEQPKRRQADPDPQLIYQHAGEAVAQGVAPESVEGRALLDRIVPADTPAEQRRHLADRIATFTDRRVERYWALMGVLNGRPPFPPKVPVFEWLLTALRASAV